MTRMPPDTSTTPPSRRGAEIPPDMAAPGLITEPRQIRALVSPVRQEIADALHSAGPLSISQLANMLGRPADALYFHIRLMERVGLLSRVGEVPTGRRAGALYDVIARPLRIYYDTARPTVGRAIIKVSGSMMRLAHRDFARAFKDGLVKPEGEHRNTWSGRAKGWVTPDELAEINRCWKRVLGILQDARPREGAQLHAATFVMTPVREKTRAKAMPRKAAGPSRRKESS